MRDSDSLLWQKTPGAGDITLFDLPPIERVVCVLFTVLPPLAWCFFATLLAANKCLPLGKGFNFGAFASWALILPSFFCIVWPSVWLLIRPITAELPQTFSRICLWVATLLCTFASIGLLLQLTYYYALFAFACIVGQLVLAALITLIWFWLGNRVTVAVLMKLATIVAVSLTCLSVPWLRPILFGGGSLCIGAFLFCFPCGTAICQWLMLYVMEREVRQKKLQYNFQAGLVLIGVGGMTLLACLALKLWFSYVLDESVFAL